MCTHHTYSNKLDSSKVEVKEITTDVKVWNKYLWQENVSFLNDKWPLVKEKIILTVYYWRTWYILEVIYTFNVMQIQLNIFVM